MTSPDPTAAGALATQDAATARIVRRVLKQWPLVFACALIAGTAGYFSSASQTKQYEATTTLQLNEVDYSAVLLGQNLQQPGQDAKTKAATNAQLVAMPSVRVAAAATLGGRADANAIRRALSVTTDPETTLIAIHVREADPRLAADIANAVREVFIEQRREVATRQVVNARDSLERQLRAMDQAERSSVTGTAMQQRLATLGSIVDTAGSGVSTADAAGVPTGAVSPSPKRAAILAVLAGGLLGIAVAFLRARFDGRIRDANEFSEIWDLPLVGSVPTSGDLIDEGRDLPSGPILEAFALARTNLRYLHMGGDVQTVVVTSSIAEEGKSTVTWNLALSSAVAEAKVLVIEADMRRPALSARLGLSSEKGLAEVLAGMVSVDEAITKVSFGDPDRGLFGEVEVLPAGLVPPSPIALLERDRLGEILASLKDRYDLILIDTPPTTVVADSLIIAKNADGVLIVSRLGKVDRSQFERLRDQLLATDAPVLGQLLNGATTSSAYGYGAYYGTSKRS